MKRYTEGSRLPSCDKYHWNQDSLFKIYNTVHSVNLKPTTRRHCVICDYYRRASPRKTKSTPKGMAYEPYGPRLGVYALSWKPPGELM